MQFAKAQGAGLAVLGLLLLLLPGYFLFHLAGNTNSPAEAPVPGSSADHTISYLPGIIGAVALGIGAFLVFVKATRGGNEEIQPKKTPSELPM